MKASYYEKWALAIAALLLEKQKVTLKQLDAQLLGESDPEVVPATVNAPFANGWALSHVSVFDSLAQYLMACYRREEFRRETSYLLFL